MTHPILSKTYYQTLSIFTRHFATYGFPAGTTLDEDYFGTSFDDAVTYYAQAMKDGGPSMVFEIDLIHGTNIDTTEEAKLRVQEWCNMRGQDFPAWMVEPEDDAGDAPDQRGYDDAREARFVMFGRVA